MATDPNPLHIFLLPFLAPGHMIPMVDLAMVFADHGVKATIVTTPVNASRISHSINRANDVAGRNHHHRQIQVLQIPFPSTAVGLPEGWENHNCFPTPEITPEFFTATFLLRQPFDQLLIEHHPDCIVSDAMYAWTLESGLQFNIPWVLFDTNNSFFGKVWEQIRHHRPHDGVATEEESFVVPGLPHRIELSKSKLPIFMLESNDFINGIVESSYKCYGKIANSCYEFDAEYIPTSAGSTKTWHMGPLFLWNRDETYRALRGEKASDDSHYYLSWLDSKEQNSVLYLSFGSLGRSTPSQLQEIAVALESMGHPFIWVVKGEEINASEWLPEGFEERKKGIVITGWAPQSFILNHKAIGGFVTHCGWNSLMESIAAGVPMITWPLFGDQFVGERLIVDILRVGVDVGAKRCAFVEEERGLVTRSEIEKAVCRVMGCGEEAREVRKRTEELSVKARRAVEEGGSSYNNMRNLIEDLMNLKRVRSKEEAK